MILNLHAVIWTRLDLSYLSLFKERKTENEDSITVFIFRAGYHLIRHLQDLQLVIYFFWTATIT